MWFLTLTRNLRRALLCKVSVLLLVFCSNQVAAQSIIDYTAVPPAEANTTTPLVMLLMSRDNQLWHKAYNDYSDLDDDGDLDTTYNDTIEYFGYFNSGYCYSYANSRFSPTAAASNPRPQDGSVRSHTCSGAWSGNFLNWLTTTRIDVVRKVLYGGYRSTDGVGSTVLQRAYIPPDNHAYVKVVDEQSVITNFTPITGETVLSFCNVTDGSGTSRDLDLSANPPLIKVAQGKHISWAAGERQQCQYREQVSGDGTDTEDFAASEPSGSINGIPSSRLVVRVAACVDGFDAGDSRSCRRYIDQDGNPSYKPYGLLQSYGEDGTYKFGLMTGSYQNNDKGGVLRKNVSYFGGPDAEDWDREIDPETGQFLTSYLNDSNENIQISGIIKTINTLRIQGWRYSETNYEDCNNNGISQQQFLTSNQERHQCRDWGNPLSEMYVEALRYFANPGDQGTALAATSEFAANDNELLPGLRTAAWEAPLTADEQCSKCSIIVLSTGLNNFDSDDLGDGLLAGLPALGSEAQLNTGWTDLLGNLEGLNQGAYIVGVSEPGQGQTTNGTEGECDAKSITRLSSVSGPCPEVPSQKGSYAIAGAAYYAHQNDLRQDLQGVQNVKTFTVALAESLPSFELKSSSGSQVTMSPTCRSNTEGSSLPSDDNWTACSLVDLIVLEGEDIGAGEFYARYVIAWEDSQWGNDYDMDSHVVIEYCGHSGSAAEVQANCPLYTTNVNSEFGNGLDQLYRRHNTIPAWEAASDNQIQLRTSLVGYAGGAAMQLGFAISGTSDGSGDGPYLDEILSYGDNNFSAVSEAIDGAFGAATDRMTWSPGIVKLTGSDPSETRLERLENPLWYAAKWGNFDPAGSATTTLTGTALTQPQWDKRDIRGRFSPNGDGIPDAYFPVRNPSNLQDALRSAFEGISNRISSGSSAAVNAQSGRGEGAIYQALYTPALKDNLGSPVVTWFGSLNGLFIDDQGRIREDRVDPAVPGESAGRLTNYDRVLVISVDSAGAEVTAKAFSVNADGSTGEQDGAPFTLTSAEYNTLWSATEGLDNVANYTDQRTYGALADTGRYIFTAIDRDGDGLVVTPDYQENSQNHSEESDTAHPFVVDNFQRNSQGGPGGPAGPEREDWRYLDAIGDQFRMDLVNFIRGEEGQNDSRSRTHEGQKYLLGDIIHSSPVGVGRPTYRYDLVYGDASYFEYYERYKNRRNVVYVGANDGMLHAFNSGFFVNDPLAGVFGFNLNNADVSAVAHPLGSELWAYVPFNALPHLKWLKDPSYQHVYYVDGAVQSFDVNIFAGESNTTYPNGWGTIIVASMRFGGGDYSLDHDGDNNTPEATLRSSYIVMDVTDPESPPKLIAEISDPELGYTTSRPTLIKRRVPNSNGNYTGSGAENTWQLVFGSGPIGTDQGSRAAALQSAVSNSTAKIFTFDLAAKQLVKHELTGDLASFVGGIEAADWNLDYIDDAFYFGTVAGTPQAPSGALKRATLANNTALTPSFSDLLSGAGLAISATPSVARFENDFWVHVGSGRFYVSEDNLLNQQQRLFGIKEPAASGSFPNLSATVALSSLVDVTGIDVYEDGYIETPGQTSTLLSNGSGNVTATTFQDALDYVDDSAGWTLSYRDPGQPADAANNIPDTTASRLVANTRIRSTTKIAYGGTTLVNTAYEGTGEICSAEGSGILLTPHLAVGLPAPFAALGIDAGDVSSNSPNDPHYRALQGANLGGGIPSDPVVVPSSGGGFTILTQKSDGELSATDLSGDPLPPGRTGWREIPLD